jgi:ketosteroid isomerase-like protein
MTHPNVEFVQRFYELFARGEMHNLAHLFADDFVFMPAGKHCWLAGPRVGADELLRFTEQQSELTNGTWVPRPYDILASDEHAAVLVTVNATRNGHSHDFHLVHLWQIHDGRATQLRSYVDDQYAYDDFFVDCPTGDGSGAVSRASPGGLETLLRSCLPRPSGE